MDILSDRILPMEDKEMKCLNKKCYAITPTQAKYLYSKAYGKKSVKWSWFDEHAYIVERLKAPLRWNIQKLYEEVI